MRRQQTFKLVSWLPPLSFQTVAWALLWLSACGPSLYELPDPPPREAWRHHSLNPAEDEERSHQNFLAAQDAVLSFLEALDEQRHEDAYRLLSNETRILLDDLSPAGRGESVLEDGQIERNGDAYRLDPVDLFVIADLQELVDLQSGREEAETYRRKEIYAVSGSGDVHHLVLIFEEDGWRLHRPSIALTPGSPGRRLSDS